MTPTPRLDPCLLPRLRERIRAAETRPPRGRLARVLGTTLEAGVPGAHVGDLCRVSEPGGPSILAEVVGIGGPQRVHLMPIGEVAGLSLRAEVVPTGRPLRVGVGERLLGHLLDGLGRPHGAGEMLDGLASVPVAGAAPDVGARVPACRPLPFGIRCVDALLTCAEGQRVGVFGPAGAGKSSLVKRLMHGARGIDVVVAALVGERGREVPEFLADLGEARARSVVVVATSERPFVERVKAAETATAVAEWFRDRGKRVLLLVDSVTRLARAWNEIGRAMGEPETRGYTPYVRAALPRLLERAGATGRGSITAFYTVLVEEDVRSDPLAEEVKSIVDGHVVLSRRLAETGHHPAIDVLASVSRVMNEKIVEPDHFAAASRLRLLLSRYAEAEFLLKVGEYKPGGDPDTDAAVARKGAIDAFLRQTGTSPEPYERTVAWLKEVVA